MRIHVLQHEIFEGPGLIEEWASQKGFELTITKIFAGDRLPALTTFDWLIIMGGSMSVNDTEKFSWLNPEKEFIRQAIEAGKILLGVCLGSQMIADVLGAKVFPNRWKEIGWHSVSLTEAGKNSDWFPQACNGQIFFHWHGDTFDLPSGATHLAYSEACRNQAYVMGDKIFGWQFHPETNEQTLAQMVQSGGSELAEGKYVMSAEAIFSGKHHLQQTKPLCFELLDRMARANVTKA